MKHQFPVVDKTDDYFDDGKIRESRRYPVLITKIVPFGEIDVETLAQWLDEIRVCPHLYAVETDHFIFGDLNVDDRIEPIVFVRTKYDGRWFSLGWWAGQLDVDGELLKSITK